MDNAKITEQLEALKENIDKVIIGDNGVCDCILTALIAGGHVLIEDMPGTGKTMLAKSLAASLDAKYSRIQFTPDLLPTDITGLNVYSKKDDEFKFVEGPVVTNILLADEINRATPRTQSALLEAMEEFQITVDGKTRELPNPFMVIATQNPVESAGTYPLPEAQMDRFMFKLKMPHLSKEDEIAMLNRFYNKKADPMRDIKGILSVDDILEIRKCAYEVSIHPDLLGYLVDICASTRNNSAVSYGVSHRGTQSFMYAVKAFALINKRDYVIPEDIKKLAVSALSHRIICYGVVSAAEKESIIREIIAGIKVPSEDFGGNRS